jgi:hypothetical protein
VMGPGRPPPEGARVACAPAYRRLGHRSRADVPRGGGATSGRSCNLGPELLASGCGRTLEERLSADDQGA